MKLIIAMFYCVLMMQSVTTYAESVYVTQGANGPVFSNKPAPGAKEMNLKPLNIVTPPPEVKNPKPAPPPVVEKENDKDESKVAEGDDSAYRSFAVVSPERNGSIVANTGVFEVRVAVDPPLLLGEGHAFVISINGRPVGQRFTATEFMIPPEFWGDTLPPANQNYQLDASIVDGEGRIIKDAEPVRFFMRYARVVNPPRRPMPRPPVQAPPAKPKTEAVQESREKAMPSSKALEIQ